MTVLIYKVGNSFTKSYFEAQKISTENKLSVEKIFVEYPNKELDEIFKVPIEELVDKYNKKEVKFV